MSVFAAPAMPLPPRYSSTRPQPPPYKAMLSKQLSSNPPSIPPPIYKATTNATTTSSRSSSPSPSISTIAEPPQYASIISSPKPKPQPTATATRVRNLPTWKDPYVETDAADSIYELQQRSERRRAEEGEEEEEESSNWCLGCFWVGPSMQQPWVSHLVI
jgi:hypothetical protein